MQGMTASAAGASLDRSFAMMLVCARLRHVAGTQRDNKKYMNMRHLETASEGASLAGRPPPSGDRKPFCA